MPDDDTIPTTVWAIPIDDVADIALLAAALVADDNDTTNDNAG
jgi:hypothetical protein